MTRLWIAAFIKDQFLMVKIINGLISTNLSSKEPYTITTLNSILEAAATLLSPNDWVFEVGSPLKSWFSIIMLEIII